MRFAHKRYYVERYFKCDCCGVLIYGAGAVGGHRPIQAVENMIRGVQMVKGSQG